MDNNFGFDSDFNFGETPVPPTNNNNDNFKFEGFGSDEFNSNNFNDYNNDDKKDKVIKVIIGSIVAIVTIGAIGFGISSFKGKDTEKPDQVVEEINENLDEDLSEEEKIELETIAEFNKNATKIEGQEELDELLENNPEEYIRLVDEAREEERKEIVYDNITVGDLEDVGLINYTGGKVDIVKDFEDLHLKENVLYTNETGSLKVRTDKFKRPQQISISKDFFDEVSSAPLEFTDLSSEDREILAETIGEEKVGFEYMNLLENNNDLYLMNFYKVRTALEDEFMKLKEDIEEIINDDSKENAFATILIAYDKDKNLKAINTLFFNDEGFVKATRFDNVNLGKYELLDLTDEDIEKLPPEMNW